MKDIDEELMEELYRADKVLIEDAQWERDSENPRRFYLRSEAVPMEGDGHVEVRGEWWPKAYSFTLTHQNEIIRAWDFIDDGHDGISGGHKHRYTEGEYKSDDPYEVDDVTTSDVNQGLIDFLDECRIKRGGFSVTEIPELINNE